MDNKQVTKSERGGWGSHFGFLMAAIGSAVGLGNIWGFPYKMGANGGSAFLLVYLVLVVLCGMCVMLGELAIGRKTGLGPVGAYKALCAKHTWLGYIGVLCGFLIVSFYSVLGGIVLRYCVGYIVSMFGGDGWAGQGTGFFGYFLYQGGEMILYFAIFMALNVVIVMGGIKGGIEKFSTIAMPALFVMLLGIIVYILCQPGALEGYKFMFTPDFTYLKDNFFTVVTRAAGQMFFSLSLGMGCMIGYGSYLSKKSNLQKSAVTIVISDTVIALMAGCAVLPAVAAFADQSYGKGPGLLFSTMLTVFDNMGGFLGNFIGFLFFFLVLLAAVTSSISLLEVCTTFVVDKRLSKGKPGNRKIVTTIAAVIAFVIGIPVTLDALGSGNAAIMFPGEILGLEKVPMFFDCWLDLYDGIAEGILMPVGALVMTFLIGWVYKTKMVKDECECEGNKFFAFKFFDICFKVVTPIIMAIVLYGQIADFF